MQDQLQLLQLTNVAKSHLISMSKWVNFYPLPILLWVER